MVVKVIKFEEKIKTIECNCGRGKGIFSYSDEDVRTKYGGQYDDVDLVSYIICPICGHDIEISSETIGSTITGYYK